MSQEKEFKPKHIPAKPVPAKRLASLPWTKVDSSNVRRLARVQDGLTVQFHDGSIYHYHSVSDETHKKLLTADSVGKALHQHLKPHHHYSKIPIEAEKQDD